jgi:hypothetical protein
MKVYGFGSYFISIMPYRDIDILIVHDSVSRQSCLQAIELKRMILKEINKANVSILSKSAEKHFDFINASGAILLGNVNESDYLPYLKKIILKIRSFRET